MGIQEEGIEAEQWLLQWFKDKGIAAFQPDAISYEEGKYVLNEIKNQEFFKSPPFDGHGLPRWQIEARTKFSIETGIRIRLIIKEKGTEIVYWQWLDVLDSGKYHDTFGEKPRRVYPLGSFIVL